jgi:hypothetical protein
MPVAVQLCDEDFLPHDAIFSLCDGVAVPSIAGLLSVYGLSSPPIADQSLAEHRRALIADDVCYLWPDRLPTGTLVWHELGMPEHG